MSAAFEVAPFEVSKTVYDVANEFHRGFGKVRFAVLLATSGGRLPAIEAKITSPLHRAAGAADVVLVISESAWKRRDDEARKALVDHALSGVGTVERNGELSRDTAGRPRIRRIPKDTAVGWLNPWRRWGSASVEAQSLAKLKQLAGDLAG